MFRYNTYRLIMYNDCHSSLLKAIVNFSYEDINTIKTDLGKYKKNIMNEISILDCNFDEICYNTVYNKRPSLYDIVIKNKDKLNIRNINILYRFFKEELYKMINFNKWLEQDYIHRYKCFIKLFQIKKEYNIEQLTNNLCYNRETLKMFNRFVMKIFFELYFNS